MTTRDVLPTGTVTFLFTDIEGSTRLVQRAGARASELFDVHAELIRDAVTGHGGIEVNTDGDAFFCVFSSAEDAVAAVVAAQRAFAMHPWPAGEPVRVRMGLHTGSGTIGGDNYFGIDVHRAARIGDVGHGGQVVISEATRGVVGDALPAGVSIRDLGLHRLKDLTAPEHLFDLEIDDLPSDFPPLRSLGRLGSGLPEPLSTFIGREGAVASVVDLFDTTRLVTLTGPGGIGKSRLSLHVAHRLERRFDATYFVALAAIRDPALVPSAILKALGDPPTGRPATERLPALLSDKRWLLVLDNFEQVVEAAPVVASMLRAAPDVSVLVSSRTSLRIAGESEYPVAPLTLASGSSRDEILASEAVALFIDRARDVRPDLELDDDALAAIVEITNRLEGMPLAIELAAARVRILPPTAMRQRMGAVLDLLASGSRDVDARQRTLRGAVAWSYDLLSDAQRGLFEDFSVFRGGATLDAIESTCGIDRDYWAWLEELDALVGHSLITRVETGTSSRFAMYEVIREFAAERLAAREGTGQVLERHFSYFLDVVERAAHGVLTKDQGIWLSTLDDERDNIRSALDWIMDQGEAHRAARMVFGLWRYWHMRGPIPEGMARAQKVLAMEQLRPADRLLVLEAIGGLAWWSGDMDHAEAAYFEALDIARNCGTDAQISNALYNAGLSVAFAGGEGDGVELLEEGLEIAERIDDPLLRSRCLWGLATIHQFDHDFSVAQEKLKIAVEGFRDAGDEFMVQWANREIGINEMALEQLDESAHHLAVALEFFASAGDRSGTMLLLRDTARLAALRGDTDRALRILGAAQELERVSGVSVDQFEMEALGLESPLVIDDQARADALIAEGRAWTIDQVVAYAADRDPATDGYRPPAAGSLAQSPE